MLLAQSEELYLLQKLKTSTLSRLLGLVTGHFVGQGPLTSG